VAGDAITPSLDQLKALTHPVRVRMLGILRTDGPATATALATRLGLNTGATSYHLRQLAQHGFVEDDRERGSGRERWWQAVHRSTHTDPERLGEGGEEVMNAYLQSVAATYVHQLQRALEERPLLPEEWRAVGTVSDWHRRLTPEQTRALRDRIGDLVAEVDDSDEPGAEHVVLQVNLYPEPGRLGPAEPGEGP